MALEHSIMQSKGLTALTTASCTVGMNTGRVVGDSRPIKTRNSPILKSKKACGRGLAGTSGQKILSVTAWA